MPKLSKINGVEARVARYNAALADKVYDYLRVQSAPATTIAIAKRMKVSVSHAHRVIDQLWREGSLMAFEVERTTKRGRPPLGYLAQKVRKKSKITLDAAS